MEFIKGLIITRIDYKNKEEIKKYFDLKLYRKYKNSYYLKENILNENIKNIRKELLELTKGDGDSLKNSDAYILDENIENLLNNKIHLIEKNIYYYYENHKKEKIETIKDYINKNKIKLYGISLIWDISNIKIEDKTFFIIFINNLIKKSINNPLKGATYFTITN